MVTCCQVLHTWDVLTHWSAARPRASPRDLPPTSVHAPAVSRTAMALHGFISTVLITCRYVLSYGWSGAPWTSLRCTKNTVSVALALCFRPLWTEKWENKLHSERRRPATMPQMYSWVHLYLLLSSALNSATQIPGRPWQIPFAIQKKMKNRFQLAPIYSGKKLISKHSSCPNGRNKQCREWKWSSFFPIIHQPEIESKKITTKTV